MYANTNYSMSTSQEIYTQYIALIAGLNVHQFALRSNSPNTMFAKCTEYTV